MKFSSAAPFMLPGITSRLTNGRSSRLPQLLTGLRHKLDPAPEFRMGTVGDAIPPRSRAPQPLGSGPEHAKDCCRSCTTAILNRHYSAAAWRPTVGQLPTHSPHGYTQEDGHHHRIFPRHRRGCCQTPLVGRV